MAILYGSNDKRNPNYKEPTPTSSSTPAQKAYQQSLIDRAKSGGMGSTAGAVATKYTTPALSSGVKNTIRLSDSQVNTLGQKGVREGDFIPNTKMALRPDGTVQLGSAPSGGARVQSPTPKTMMERALTGEFGDAVKNMAIGSKKDNSTITSDSGNGRKKEKELSEEIGFKSQRGPLDLTYLQEAEQQAKKSLREGESGINANFDMLRRGQEAAQGKEAGAMSAGLARAGGYLGFTSSGESMMVSLEKSHRSEMLDLESKRTQALSEARQAYNDQMYDVAREKQELATQYEKDQWEEKQAYFEKVKSIQEEEAKKDEQSRVNMDIYNALQLDGVKDEMDVFAALKGKATPEQIASFFKTVAPKTTESDLFKPTNTQTAMLMGAGFGADDIQSVYDHLNEYGYDDVLKASLTPYQRRVMDDMLTMKPEKVASAGGSSGKVPEYSFSAADRKKLVSAGLTFDEITNIQRDIAEYGIDAVLEGLEVDPTVFPGFGTVEDMIRRISTDQTARRKEEGAKAAMARASSALNDVFDKGGSGGGDSLDYDNIGKEN